MFDPAPQRAATHQKRIDHQRFRLRRHDDHAHQSVVAKPVAHVHRQTVRAGLAQLPNLGVRPPNGGEVELIGALGKLCGAFQILRLQAANLDGQFQVLEEVS